MENKKKHRLGRNRILSLKKVNDATNLNNDNGVSTSSNLSPKKCKVSENSSSSIQTDEIPLSFDVSSYFKNDNLTPFETDNKIETMENTEYSDNQLNFAYSELQLTYSERDVLNNTLTSTNNCDTEINNSVDDLSQFYESSQVLKQIETVISSCDDLNNSKQEINENNSFKEPTVNVIKHVLKKVKENDDVINDIMSDKITNLFKSSQYKEEVSGLFDQLENTICQATDGQDINLQRHTTFNNPESILTTSVINHDWENDTIDNISLGINELIKESLFNSPDFQPQESTHPPDNDFVEMGPFYGLPNKVKELIQQYKGIEKLYDWQNECLKLKAVQERKNLVYALPTSGGKTLVSEILIFREIMCRRKNVIFILPYVSIVQEKVWALSPFALALNFLVEEYAAGKGKLPPRRRRTKRSVYIATIEKALGVVNALLETNRLSEIGLVVVDELHLLGEGSRGATLEQLLTKLLHFQENIHIVGMSATIGNLEEMCVFLKAEVYAQNFRPVELKEYVKCGNQIAQVDRNTKILVPARTVDFQYCEEVAKLDPDRLGGLVMEVIPSSSCLVFCATKKNCENVAILLSRILFRNLLQHRQSDKLLLLQAFRAEGALCPILRKTIPFGVAYHHSGLTADERRLIEDSFRIGTLSVICCTSTLAAGVNLPARRVILRSPYIGREFLNLARYKQMSGRAGRAGLGDSHGESILICEEKDMQKVLEMLSAPMNQVKSQLAENDLSGLRELVLSCIALGTAKTRRKIRDITTKTLLAVQGENVKILTDEVLSSLFKLRALQLETDTSEFPKKDVSILLQDSTVNANSPSTSQPRSNGSGKQILIHNDSKLIISKLGKAAIKGGLDLDTAHILYDDLIKAQESLVLLNCLHLLYLVTPYDLARQMQPELQTYYNIYMELGQKELQTACIIGIDEACCSSMMTGRRIKVKERILNRFYLTLILYEQWNGCGVFEVAEKFQVSRGIVQQLMVTAATFSANVVRFCEELDELWAFAELLKGLGQRLQHCSARELEPLMELPSVKQTRARQLHQAGYKTLQNIARADPKDLIEKISHMSRRVANQLIASAKLQLLERVENLREEAEDVLEGIDSQHPNIQ